MLLHLGIGMLLTWLVESSLQDVARNFLLPLSSILIGLTFAWGGNAQVILQTEEIETFSSYHPGGLQEYVYTYQSAILMIITTIVFWGIAALGIFDNLLKWHYTWYIITVTPAPLSKIPLWYSIVKIWCYLLSSLALRECWQIIFAAHLMLLIRKRVRDVRRTE